MRDDVKNALFQSSIFSRIFCPNSSPPNAFGEECDVTFHVTYILHFFPVFEVPLFTKKVQCQVLVVWKWGRGSC